MNGMTAEHTEAFSACDNDAMHIGAISYSDAVVFGDADVSTEVLKFVKSSQKPTLEYNLTSDYENYYNLYEEIANEELVSLA
jgi:starch synthase